MATVLSRHFDVLSVSKHTIWGYVHFQGEINLGATVTVLERPSISACTNCDGDYVLNGLVPGTYTLQVTNLPLGIVLNATVTVVDSNVEQNFDWSLSVYECVTCDVLQICCRPARIRRISATRRACARPRLSACRATTRAPDPR